MKKHILLFAFLLFGIAVPKAYAVTYDCIVIPDAPCVIVDGAGDEYVFDSRDSDTGGYYCSKSNPYDAGVTYITVGQVGSITAKSTDKSKCRFDGWYQNQDGWGTWPSLDGATTRVLTSATISWEKLDALNKFNGFPCVVPRFIPLVTISTAVSPEGAGCVEGGGTVDKGGSMTLSATANFGYEFAKWQKDGQDVQGSATLTVSGISADATYTAVFRPITYSVAFSSASGSGSMTAQEFTYGVAQALISNAFVKTGHSFSGWATNSSGTVVFADGAVVSNLTTQAKGTVTLSACWTANVYRVTFDANGGNSPSPDFKFVTYGTDYGDLAADCVRTGYVFAGWFTAASGGTQVKADTKVTIADDQTLYAHWTAKKYTVTFDPNGGEGEPSSRNVTYGMTYDSSGSLPEPRRTGYGFAGWFTASEDGEEVTNKTVVAITSAQTLYAHWTANEYKVYFNGSGGASGTMDPQPFTYDVAQALVSNRYVRTGHSFSGWATTPSGEAVYADGETVSNLTASAGGQVPLYTTWVPVHYTVRFDAQGGTGTMADQSFAYGEGQNLSSNCFTRVGYSFVGWKTSGQGGTTYSDKQWVSNLSSEDGAIVVLEAQWKANAYRVTFDLNGGMGPTPAATNVTYDSTYGDLPEPKRTGYTFAGWWTERTGGSEITSATTVTITSAKTLYAHWTPNAYELRFNRGEGASGEMENQPFAYDEAKAIALNLFERDGQLFAGWATAGAGAVVFTDGEIVSNLTTEANKVIDLYARWENGHFTVRFDGNGGTGTMADQPFDYGEEKGLSSNAFTRLGYSFAGWAKSAKGEVAYQDGETVSNLTTQVGGIVSLYAQWNEGVCTNELSIAADCDKMRSDGRMALELTGKGDILTETGSDSGGNGKYIKFQPGDASAVCLCATLTGRGKLVFSYKTSMPSYDPSFGDLNHTFAFSAGGFPVVKTDVGKWTEFEYDKTTDEGLEVVWEFNPYSDYEGDGGDYALVDNIRWIPEQTEPDHPVPGADDAAKISSAAVEGDRFRLSFKSDERFDYNLLTNANLLIRSWGVLDTFTGDGSVHTFEPVIRKDLPQLFYRVETIQRK